MKENNKDCTLLINSYDGGEDLWDNFFSLLEINWPNIGFPIVLNTESKKYTYKDWDTKTFSLYKPGSRVSWAKRFKETLKHIDTKYVIVLLDDFWLDDKVDVNMINNTIEYMKVNPDIVNFCFQNTSGTNIDDRRFPEYVKKDRYSEYKYCCQAGIWRREELMSFLRFHETAWDWEVFGNKRSYKNDYAFYCLKKNIRPPFSYNVPKGGVIHRGMWNKDVVEDLVNKYDIKVDCSKRGYVPDEEWKKSGKRSTLYEKITKPNFFRRLRSSIALFVHKTLSSI